MLKGAPTPPEVVFLVAPRLEVENFGATLGLLPQRRVERACGVRRIEVPHAPLFRFGRAALSLEVGCIAARWLQVLQEQGYLLLGRCELSLLPLFRLNGLLELHREELVLALQAP